MDPIPTIITSVGEYALSSINACIQNAQDIKKQKQTAILEEQTKQNAFTREAQRKALDGGLAIVSTVTETISKAVEEGAKRKTDVAKTDSDIRKAFAEEKLSENQLRFEAEMEERRLRFEAEMEEFKTDKDLQRRFDVLESIYNCQREVTEAANASMMILAAMPLELHHRAEEMLLEEQDKHRELEVKWQENALQQCERIQTSFANNERMRIAMEDIILDGMKEMMQSTSDTLRRMERNIAEINDNAKLLSQKGQMMVEKILPSTLPMKLETRTYDQIEKHNDYN